MQLVSVSKILTDIDMYIFGRTGEFPILLRV